MSAARWSATPGIDEAIRRLDEDEKSTTGRLDRGPVAVDRPRHRWRPPGAEATGHPPRWLTSASTEGKAPAAVAEAGDKLDPRTWSVVASSFVIIWVPRLLLRHRGFSQASSRVGSKWPFFLQTRRSISFVGYIDGNISPMTERDRSIPITGAVCKAFTVHKVTVILPSHQLTSTCMRWNCDYHFLNHKDRTITNTSKSFNRHFAVFFS